MKVAIVGSRDYPHLQQVRDYVNRLPAGTTVVSGAARGVDRTAADTARACGLEVEEYPANWSTGRGAGYARNHAIVEAADRIVAFWDGESRGTAHTLRLAQAQQKPVEVIQADEQGECP